MSDLIIHGGQPLSGTITPSGNKNSVLPILCATLLSDGESLLRNVPRLRDIDTTAALLAAGADTEPGFWMPGQHYSPAANRVVAERLEGVLSH